MSPNKGGSNLRNPETTRRLQIVQQLRSPSKIDGNLNLTEKGHPCYVGISSQALSSVEEKTKAEKENKNEVKKNL